MLTFDTGKLSKPDRVVETLSELIRKIYNPNNFKGIVSPHEFLQSIGLASKGKYRIGNQSDPAVFLQWLFVWIHSKLKRKGTNSSIVTDCFQGELFITEHVGDEMEQKKTPFKLLTLEIPQMSVFNDANAISQIPIYDLFYKFDGNTPNETEVGKFCTYSIWRLPEYLIIIVKRFYKNNFFVEKNSTIVTFPLKSLNMSSCLHPDAVQLNPLTKYNLVASITHVGQPENGSYKVYVCHQPTGDWYEVEDLLVTPVLAQLVTLSEAYVQIYQLVDE